MSERALLEALFRAALDEVHAGRATARALARLEIRAPRVAIAAGGKAACAMAEAALDVLGARVSRGLVSTKDGHARAIPGLDVREAAHPVPDARSVANAEAALALAHSLAPDEALLVLVSGGASSVWCAPRAGVTLDEKRTRTAQLLASGASIAAINAERRALSRIKGGGLARAAGQRELHALLVSDVPGDRPLDIGSGPAGEHGTVVASLAHALSRVEREAESRGLRVLALGRALDGDVSEVAARLAQSIRTTSADLIVAGGEPTVRVVGKGKGGRAQELAARLARALAHDSSWSALCAGSDGTDGPTDVDGAFCDGASWPSLEARGLDPDPHLEANDTYPLFAALGAQLVTGPTETNVADLFLARVRRDPSPR